MASGRREGGGTSPVGNPVLAPPRPERIRREIREGLTGSPRRLPARFFYDARGAQLFEEITGLDEYYLTDAEVEILGQRAARVAELVGPGVRMVEYGSGSGEKTWIVLRELEAPSAYVPVDVAREQLLSFARRVRERFPGLEVLPVAADYTRLDELPWPEAESGATLAFFPGSTVGNLEPVEAVAFLEKIAEQTGRGEYLLIGADLVKDRRTLERAYNDSRGVTAEFNLNILRHLNRLLGADFDPEGFRHRAIWNDERSRIEMHLVSLRDQAVTLGDPEGEAVEIRQGEVVVTEHSYKYEIDFFHDLVGRAGYRAVEYWTDDDDLFSVHLLKSDPPG